MADYISKERAQDLIVTAAQGNGSRLACMLGKLEDEPPADVAPVRHGRWTRIDYHDARCSECGHKTYYPDRISLYCPECGARMDGE